MTRKELLKEVYSMDPTLKLRANEESRDAYMFLLGALVDGPLRANKTAQIPEARRRKFAKNMKENGVFVGNKVHANWNDPEDGSIEFVLDVNVALGYMTRVK